MKNKALTAIIKFTHSFTLKLLLDIHSVFVDENTARHNKTILMINERYQRGGIFGVKTQFYTKRRLWQNRSNKTRDNTCNTEALPVGWNWRRDLSGKMFDFEQQACGHMIENDWGA